MKIKSIAPWFGGKRTMASDIVCELGQHTQYFEPFCGSMAVLFAKKPSKQETVNDLHGDLINLARVLQRESMAIALYERLVGALVSEGLLRDARAYLESTPLTDHTMVDRAYHYFVASWVARNGVAGTARVDYQIAVRWTKGGGSPTVRFRNAVDSLPAWHRRLLNVVILNRDALGIVHRFEDAAHTVIYIDCPYPPETLSGDHRYLHDFSAGDGLFGGEDDHIRLRDALVQYKKARVVVSTYECKRYRDLYDGWTFRAVKRAKNLANQNRRGGSGPADAPEVLILNGPSYANSQISAPSAQAIA